MDNLNTEQKFAVDTTDGAVLVLSGAGTGKTRVLTTRIANILSKGLASPWQILALTFTNKAALEMKNRIAQIAAGQWDVQDLWCGTFHSVCLRILRANAQRAGLRQDFLIYGEDDQKATVKTVFVSMGLDVKEYPPSDWVEKFSAIKDKGIGHLPPVNIEKKYNAYNAELTRLNAVDFGDIILKVLELFSTAPDILEKYQRQFKYVMVDEYQDTNNSQHQFLKMISGGYGNICCVGDDDQSIYSWRGAEIKHILNFDTTYPDAQIIRLETNYRSTQNILNAANSLIHHNQGRLGKDLRSAPGVGAGEKIYVVTLPTEWTEARMISDGIVNSGVNYSDCAVLIRAGSLSRPIEEEFAARAIPYRLVGATKFYDRAEIKDIVAYIRLLVHPFDDLSFMRVIAKPRRGFGDMAIQKLRGYGANLMAALNAAPLTGRQRQNADEFCNAFKFDWDVMMPKDAVQHLLEESGYLKMWRTSALIDAKDRLENINELVNNVVSKYDTLAEFLEHAALMITSDDNDGTDQQNDKNAVSVMTIHAAKGLEFDTVFLPAWEDGVFPNDMAINEGSLEEERRLAYVAITRARRRAIISNTTSRMVFGERKSNPPSRFINEIDTEFLNIHGGNIYMRPKPSVQTTYDNIRPKKYVSRNNSAAIVGKLATHNEMGRGVIIEDGGDIITIVFRNHGIKKVARKFIIIGN